jgi:hypothetical protein
VLVLGRVYVVAERVRGGPHLCLKCEIGAGVLIRRCRWHVSRGSLRRDVDGLLKSLPAVRRVEIREMERKHKPRRSKQCLPSRFSHAVGSTRPLRQAREKGVLWVGLTRLDHQRSLLMQQIIEREAEMALHVLLEQGCII